MSELSTYLKSNKASIAAGTVSSVSFGLIGAWQQPDRNFWFVVLMITIITMPILIPAWKILWFDRESAAHDRDMLSRNIESTWEQQSAAVAFWILACGLIYLDLMGRIMDIGWMAPITTVHVLVLGGAAFLGTYFWKKRDQG